MSAEQMGTKSHVPAHKLLQDMSVEQNAPPVAGLVCEVLPPQDPKDPICLTSAQEFSIRDAVGEIADEGEEPSHRSILALAADIERLAIRTCGNCMYTKCKLRREEEA